MKLLSTILFLFYFLSPTIAGVTKSKLTIVPNAKTSQLEIKYKSKFKKNLPAQVIILDKDGNEVKSFRCDVKNGTNTICMQDALQFNEGIYTVQLKVKKKTSSSKFILFK